MKKVNGKKEESHKEDPVDQASMDLHFVESFVDLLWSLCEHTGHLETLKTSTVSAQCYEALRKIKNVQKFIQSVPINIVATKN
jgi:hypothetical protein